MSVLEIAQSVRKNTASDEQPIPLGKAHQLVAAALGYKSLASLQAAHKANLEAPKLHVVEHVVVSTTLLRERAKQLDLPYDEAELTDLLVEVIGAHLAGAKIHTSESVFEEFLQELAERVVMDDDKVASEMGNANFDGVTEIYVPIESTFRDGAVGRLAAIQFEGHITLGLDLERPYSGHVISVKGALEAQRYGRNCFGRIECVVTGASLGDGTDEDDGEPPVRTASQAYADLLGLAVEEVGNLVDVEPEAQEGHSGEMIYSYILDFTDQADPEIERKILLKHESLRIEVDPSFFDGVRSSDWPR